MLFSSKRLSKLHNLHNQNTCQTKQSHITLERVNQYKLLGVTFNEHLDWSDHFQSLTKSCYAILAKLRKIKRFTPFNVRKQLAHSLVLSKIDYCNVLFNNTPEYMLKRLQKVQNSAASFVVGKYCKTISITELNWIPVRGRIDFSILKLVYKRLHTNTLPDYLTLRRDIPRRTLRSSENDTILWTPIERNTFEGSASRLFNTLPINIQREHKKTTFNKLCHQYLLDQEISRILST